MKWLLIAIFCFSSASAVFLGSKRCTWGPAYWCRDLQTAKTCSAVPHCVRMWKAQPSASVSSKETCVVCNIVIRGLKTMVANKKTQEEIKELAEELCDFMKNEKTAYEVCNTVVYLYLPEVFQLIHEDLDADTICKLLHLCDSSKLKNKLNRLTKVLEKAKSVKHFEHCNECELAVVIVRGYLKDKKVQKAVIHLFDEVCPKLSGDLKIFCTTFTATEMPKFFKLLEQLLDPETICSLLGLCPRNSHKVLTSDFIAKVVKSQKFRKVDVECELCQAGISDIRNTLRDATFQKELKHVLETDVCSRLGSLAAPCLKYVDMYFSVAIKFAINELNPVLACKTLDLCPTSGLPAMKLSPAKVIRERSPRALPLCAICEFVLHKLESMIGTNRTEAAITAALESVCSIMPQTIRTNCDNFVDKYAPEIVKLLVEDIAPTAVCTALGLCVGKTDNSHELLFHRGRGNLL